MDVIFESKIVESLTSLRSSIAKTTKSLASMEKKGVNTTLAKKRLKALSIGLTVLEHSLGETTQQYSPEALSEAREVLAALISSVQTILERSKPGSSQKTLLERRITSLEQAVQTIDMLMVDNQESLPF